MLSGRPGPNCYRTHSLKNTLTVNWPPYTATAGGAAVRPRILQLRGASDSEFAHDIAIRNLGFLHSAPTFMADYEMPSGGDWSIHRGGAVFLDGATQLEIPILGAFLTDLLLSTSHLHVALLHAPGDLLHWVPVRSGC